MDLSLKQRLLGASVLVALAVIFLPLLFDGAGQRAKRELDIQIPPPPPVPVSRLKIPQPPLEVVESLPVVVTPVVKVEPTLSQKKPQTTTAVRQPVGKVESKKADLLSWVLQVGSYKERKNAQNARDKLKKMVNYHAFIEEANGNSGRVYRVRVGPLRSRVKADALRQTLQKKEGVKAIVLRHH
ncbi:MAG: SPOR domain-containing protein [Gammaproteobacteria bacterium]|nr:SPOR domain-containing protein [Gammaproteobacteria bacterium]